MPRRSLSIALWLGSLLYVAWAVMLVWRSSTVALDGHRYFCLFDDAMISMRYAWNLAHGHGCCWNPGDCVQGFTSPLMVGLMALPCLVLSKSTACLVVQLLGISTVLAVAHNTRRLGEFVAGDRRLAAVCFLAILLYYPLSFWSLMGMETGLLCLCAVTAVLHALRNDGRKSTIAMAVGFLARPDFLVVAAVVLTYLFLSNRRKALLCAGALGAWVALVLGVQYLYYGDILPNTYTLKMVGFPLGSRILKGAGFIAPFLGSAVFLLSFAMAGVASVASRPRYLLMFVSLATLGYQVYVGGDAWPYWRMLVPMMPALLVLAVLGAHAVVRKRAGAAAVAVVLSTVLADASFLSEMTLSAVPYKADENQYGINEAIVLNRTLRPGSTIGVVWAGVVPYYTDFRAVDFLGKSDRHIASLFPDPVSRGSAWSWTQTSLPGHSKYDLSYSIGTLKPDYVQVYRYGHSDASPWIRDFYETKVVDGFELLVRKGSTLW